MGQTVPTWRPLAFEATSATGMAHEVFRAAGTGTLNRAIRVWATRVRNMAAASITTVIRFDPVAVLTPDPNSQVLTEVLTREVPIE